MVLLIDNSAMETGGPAAKPAVAALNACPFPDSYRPAMSSALRLALISTITTLGSAATRLSERRGAGQIDAAPGIAAGSPLQLPRKLQISTENYR